jgi:hypothetical protein
MLSSNAQQKCRALLLWDFSQREHPTLLDNHPVFLKFLLEKKIIILEQPIDESSDSQMRSISSPFLGDSIHRPRIARQARQEIPPFIYSRVIFSPQPQFGIDR